MCAGGSLTGVRGGEIVSGAISDFVSLMAASGSPLPPNGDYEVSVPPPFNDSCQPPLSSGLDGQDIRLFDLGSTAINPQLLLLECGSAALPVDTEQPLLLPVGFTLERLNLDGSTSTFSETCEVAIRCNSTSTETGTGTRGAFVTCKDALLSTKETKSIHEFATVAKGWKAIGVDVRPPKEDGAVGEGGVEASGIVVKPNLTKQTLTLTLRSKTGGNNIHHSMEKRLRLPVLFKFKKGDRVISHTCSVRISLE